MNKKVTFIGCGEIATRAAKILLDADWQVTGVRRNADKLPPDIPGVSADVLTPSSLDFLQDTETVVYSLAASGFDETSYTDAYVTGLNNVLGACQSGTLKRLVFVSSTSVYHQNDGSLVDERSATEPTRFNGRIMLQAEHLARATSVACIVRFSGIYGPGRLRMIDRVRNGQCSDDTSPTLTNRIHSHDCGAVIAHLLQHDNPPELVLASDSEPATTAAVEEFIATELGIEKRTATDSKNRPKRIAGSKRCSNKLLLDSGYRFHYPDYRKGYRQLISSL